MGLDTIVLPVMALFQERLIFKPKQRGILPIKPPTEYGLNDFRALQVKSEDGMRLELWYKPPREPDLPTVIMFHGNTGHLGDVGRPSDTDVFDRSYRIALLEALQNVGVGVVAPSLRGYGNSEGKPTEAGFLRDLRSINRWLLNELKLPAEKLIYFGESLGSACSLLAAESLYRIEGKTPGMVATVAAFYSVPAKTSELYSFLPIADARRKMRHRFECARAIASLPLRTFLLLMAPELDETTPKSHSYQLAETALASRLPHQILELKKAEHITWDAREVVSLLLAFYHAHWGG